MPPTSDPTRELLEAARNLAGCAHPEHLQQPIALRPPVEGVHMLERTWCMGCGVVVLEGGDAEAPSLVLAVIDAAREADTFAANVAHAEAHAAAFAADPCPARGALVFVDERLANLIAAARQRIDDAGHALGAAQRHVGDRPLRFEDPSMPERLDAAAVRCPLCGTLCSSPEELITAHRCPPHMQGGARGARARLDAAVGRLEAMTRLVRELDQVDVRGNDGDDALAEVRTTAHVRLREAANAFVEASDELYAATDGERAGAEP